MKLNRKNVLILMFILCIAVVSIYIFVIQHNGWYETVQAVIEQEYIAKNPDTGRAILYIKTMQFSSDEDISATLIFKCIDGKVYYIGIQPSDNPDLWVLSSNKDFTELIPIKEVRHYDFNSVDIEF